ncbi:MULTISPECIES: hypothetical protein [unclassified Acidisoma]|jgi:hypothetical protein|uniref:hypothetical protein n=1 Tax=unclassified Acidisoma TaxID=2634065 RepID=UPI00131CF15D|nr:MULTISPECIES: hypothetical protein [unclassified Acidisoma]
MQSLPSGLILRRLVFGAAGALCVATGAAAQEYPSILPMRDATIVYDVQSTGSGALRVEADISAANQKLRLSEVGRPDYLLIDRGAEQVILVSPDKGMSFAVATGGFLHRQLDPGSNLHFSRAGTRSVAGIACTVWRIEGPHGAGDSCITNDGIILSAEGKGDKPDSSGRIPSGRVTALSVNYVDQPPDLFDPPDGMPTVNLPPSLFQSMVSGITGLSGP